MLSLACLWRNTSMCQPKSQRKGTIKKQHPMSSNWDHVFSPNRFWCQVQILLHTEFSSPVLIINPFIVLDPPLIPFPSDFQRNVWPPSCGPWWVSVWGWWWCFGAAEHLCLSGPANSSGPETPSTDFGVHPLSVPAWSKRQKYCKWHRWEERRRCGRKEQGRHWFDDDVQHVLITCRLFLSLSSSFLWAPALFALSFILHTHTDSVTDKGIHDEPGKTGRRKKKGDKEGEKMKIPYLSNSVSLSTVLWVRVLISSSSLLIRTLLSSFASNKVLFSWASNSPKACSS